MKIPNNTPKIEVSLSQRLIIKAIQNLPLDMFLWMTNTMKLVKISLCITKDLKIQDGRQSWQKSCSRYYASGDKPKFRNLIHTPTHLVCNGHLIPNFLSFHMSLIVVMNCGAKHVLRGFEISIFYFFLKLYFINISQDILPLLAQNAIKQCKWYFSS